MTAAKDTRPVGSIWSVEAKDGDRVDFTRPDDQTVTVVADGDGAAIVLDVEGVYRSGEQTVTAK